MFFEGPRIVWLLFVSVGVQLTLSISSSIFSVCFSLFFVTQLEKLASDFQIRR